MSKAQTGRPGFSPNSRQSARKFNQQVSPTARVHEQWNSDVDESRKVVARQIITSVKMKWRTAVALEAATGISRTEISRIKNGRLARFSLERLVWLLAIVDPELEVKLRVKLIRKHQLRSESDQKIVFQKAV